MLHCTLGILIVTSLTVEGSLVFGQSDGFPLCRHNDPNFLIILADNIGFSDIGPFGSALAKDGKVLTNFHVLPACSPTRSELLTGVDNHLNGLGAMQEVKVLNQKGKPGYENYPSDKVITVADILQDAGYDTILSGKWSDNFYKAC